MRFYHPSYSQPLPCVGLAVTPYRRVLRPVRSSQIRLPSRTTEPRVKESRSHLLKSKGQRGRYKSQTVVSRRRSLGGSNGNIYPVQDNLVYSRRARRNGRGQFMGVASKTVPSGCRSCQPSDDSGLSYPPVFVQRSSLTTLLTPATW
jgi:hypothetical protein